MSYGDDSENNEDKQDDGSVWTSYSDMFTTMAVIFLVMFVFALLRSGVKSMNAAKEKQDALKMLEGEVPRSVAEKNQKNKQEITKSINEMEKYERIVDQKMVELNNFHKKMKSHQVAMEELLDDQKNKETQVKIVNKKLEKRKQELDQTKKEVKTLTQHVVESEKIIQKMVVTNQSILNHREKIQKELQSSQVKYAELEKLHKNKMAESSDMVKELNQEISQVSKVDKETKEKLKAASQREEQKITELVKQEKVLKELSQKLNVKSMKVTAQEQKIENFQSELKEQVEKINKLQAVSKQNRVLKKIMSKMQVAINESKKEKINLEAELHSSSNMNTEMKDKVAKQKKKVDDLTKMITEQVSIKKALETELSNSKNELATASSLNAKNKNEIEKMGAQSSRLKNENKEFQNQLAKAQLEKEGHTGEIASMKKNLAQLQTKIKNKDITLAQKTSEAEQVILQKKQCEEKGQEFMALNQSLSDFRDGVQDKFRARDHIIAQLKNDNLDLKKENGKISNQVRKIGQTIDKVQKNFRVQVGQNLARKLRASKLNAIVDPDTGNIILRMDEHFLFNKNSSVLSENAKSTLNKLIPLYVDVLLKDENTRAKINNVHIIGHASPEHAGTYVDPFAIDEIEAYNYNLDLSTARAQAIVKYIFSRDFSQFENKNILRKKIAAIGKSYSEPLLNLENGRSLASVNSKNKRERCGQYDCKLSRRVEISFTLKENPQVWDHIKALQE